MATLCRNLRAFGRGISETDLWWVMLTFIAVAIAAGALYVNELDKLAMMTGVAGSVGLVLVIAWVHQRSAHKTENEMTQPALLRFLIGTGVRIEDLDEFMSRKSNWRSLRKTLKSEAFSPFRERGGSRPEEGQALAIEIGQFA